MRVSRRAGRGRHNERELTSVPESVGFEGLVPWAETLQSCHLICSFFNIESRYSACGHGWIHQIFGSGMYRGGGYGGGWECRGIISKWEVFGASRAVKDLYISVWDVLVKRLEGKVDMGINMVDLIDIIRGLSFSEYTLFSTLPRFLAHITSYQEVAQYWCGRGGGE